MPFTVKLDNAPAGIVAETARPEATSARIQVLGFHTSDEGGMFSKVAELCDPYLAGKPGLLQSQVDHMLAVIAPDLTATVYVNELQKIATVQPKRTVKTGEPVEMDDVADITKIDLGVDIPNNSAVVYFFSWFWHRGVFFDFMPLGPNHPIRDYDLPSTLAACHCSLIFSSRFNLTESQWQLLIAAGLFPFAALGQKTMNEIVNYLQNEWPLDQVHPMVISDCKKMLPSLSESSHSIILKPHAAKIKTSIERFENGDYLSAAHLIFPIIEGVLRANYKRAGTASPNQNRFLQAALHAGKTGRHNFALLLPDRFNTFLEAVVFPSFDHDAPSGVTRHTIGHGVAPEDEFTEINVGKALLTLHHLFYLLALNQEVNRISH